MNPFFSTLKDEGHHFLLQTYSALDRYYRIKNSRTFYILTSAPLASLAVLFDHVIYQAPGEYSALVSVNNATAYIQCVDTLEDLPARPFTIQHFYFDYAGNRYIDASDMYTDLRARILKPVNKRSVSIISLVEAALLISRYNLEFPSELFSWANEHSVLPVHEQRWALSSLLQTPHPEKGLMILSRIGFIQKHWPELESMTAVLQTKDHHPEGNVLNHTLEALKHRKTCDLVLSLAILLHDLGKTVAEATREKPYNDHAYRGAILAGHFLRRLEYPEELIDDVLFLIRHHMMPSALPHMPLYRIKSLLNSPLFPTLLELFRADLLSTFRGPEKYYEACRIYRAFLKKSNKPFHTLPLHKPIA